MQSTCQQSKYNINYLKKLIIIVFMKLEAEIMERATNGTYDGFGVILLSEFNGDIAIVP